MLSLKSCKRNHYWKRSNVQWVLISNVSSVSFFSVCSAEHRVWELTGGCLDMTHMSYSHISVYTLIRWDNTVNPCTSSLSDIRHPNQISANSCIITVAHTHTHPHRMDRAAPCATLQQWIPLNWAHVVFWSQAPNGQGVPTSTTVCWCRAAGGAWPSGPVRGATSELTHCDTALCGEEHVCVHGLTHVSLSEPPWFWSALPMSTQLGAAICGPVLPDVWQTQGASSQQGEWQRREVCFTMCVFLCQREKNREINDKRKKSVWRTSLK